MPDFVPELATLQHLLASNPALELLVPTVALAWAQPRRPHFAARLAAVFALLYVVAMGIYSISYLAPASDALSDVCLFAGSCALLGLAVPCVTRLFEASAWKAAFCAGAGYTIQNIGSGLSSFVRFRLLRFFGVNAEPYAAAMAGDESIYLATGCSLVSLATVYALAYPLFVRRIHERGLSVQEDRSMFAVLLLVVLVVIEFDVVIKRLGAAGASFATVATLRLVHLAVCAFVLFAQYQMLYRRSVEAELALEQQMTAERERQWRLSQENREALNLRMHDIRHQIRHLADGAGGTGAEVDKEFLASLAREVDVYDSFVETGNAALDTILSEKALVCEREAIELSVIADGSALDGLPPAEIYALFGNALDNAMQATRAVDDPDHQSISLTVRRVGELASVHMENYFTGARDFGDDGLPETTQDATQGRGFGTRSMRRIVESHGGTLTLGTRGDVFTLNALIPLG